MKRYRKLSPTLVRRLLSLAFLLCVCAMLLPLPFAPLPSNTQEKDQSQPFPCQSRPCGCRSAEQCWKKCCCFNHSQKIAWAKANKVTVPDCVLAAAAKEKLTSVEICSLPHEKSSAANVRESKQTCSRSRTERSTEHDVACDREHSDVVVGSRTAKCCQRKSEAVNEAVPRNSSSKWVMAVYSAECQGQGPNVYCSIVLVIPNSQVVKPAVPEMTEKFFIVSERLQSTSLRPPLPPPKIGEASFCT